MKSKYIFKKLSSNLNNNNNLKKVLIIKITMKMLKFVCPLH